MDTINAVAIRVVTTITMMRFMPDKVLLDVPSVKNVKKIIMTKSIYHIFAYFNMKVKMA